MLVVNEKLTLPRNNKKGVHCHKKETKGFGKRGAGKSCKKEKIGQKKAVAKTELESERGNRNEKICLKIKKKETGRVWGEEGGGKFVYVAIPAVYFVSIPLFVIVSAVAVAF